MKTSKVLLLTLLLTLCAVATSAEEPIVIGMDADMSAGAAVGGQAIKRGAEIAINEINAGGGVLGRPLTLVIKDHRGNPARGIKNIQGFASEKNLVAVLGGVHTPVALEILPALHEHQIIYLDPWAAGTNIVDNGYNPNFVFRVSVRDSDAGQVLIERAKERGFTKIALVLERTGWGRSNEVSLQKAAKQNGIEIVATRWINWRQTDFISEFKGLLDSAPEVVILVSNAPEGSVVANTNLELNANLPIISHWGIAGGAFAKSLGQENLQKSDIELLQTFHFLNNKNAVKAKFLFESYKAQYDEDATETSIAAQVGLAQAYDLIHLLANAIRATGSINRVQVRTALESLDKYDGAVKTYDPPFAPDRHDALFHEDYFMATFNDKSELIPVNE